MSTVLQHIPATEGVRKVEADEGGSMRVRGLP